MKNKQKLGQFFTTNVDYILGGFESIIKNKSVLDPFAGAGDLLKWATNNNAAKTFGLDIDKTLLSKKIAFNDSLLEIPNADFILTNPPYLAKNKMAKAQKDKYLKDLEDLYLLAIDRIVASSPQEGIIIVPVNFFSAENSVSTRIKLLDQYLITKVKYFTQQVFEDTTYNVVAFHFKKHNKSITKQDVKFKFIPDEETKIFTLDKKYNYTIAGAELNPIITTNSLKIQRLTENLVNKHKGSAKIETFFNDKKYVQSYNVLPSFKSKIDNNCILLNCIDTNSSEEGWIKAENVKRYNVDALVGKNTSRNIAFVHLPENISLNKQKQIIKLFNKTLNSLRQSYRSMFLTNFRDNDRKRVSFEFCYKLISYCYNQM